jgi:hypothetical protein
MRKVKAVFACANTYVGAQICSVSDGRLDDAVPRSNASLIQRQTNPTQIIAIKQIAYSVFAQRDHQARRRYRK